MLITLIAGSFISIVSILAFFGNVITVLGEPIGANMFDFAFGIDPFLQQSGFTFLFVFQLIISLASIATFFIVYKIKNYEMPKSRIVITAGLSGILTLAGAIWGFCAKTMIPGINQVGGVSLGIGPVMYGILNIVATVIFGATILWYKFGTPASEVHRRPSYHHNRLSNNALGTNTFSKKDDVNDNNTKADNLDLLMKYKKLLDDGIITAEEFEKKKNELL